ncbi:hypothetical protein BH20ACT2_BH20ACT2_22300 [soil metagenome]
MEILDSAHRHGVSDEDIRHAVDNAIRYHDLDDALVMLVGPTVTGALIEIGIIDGPHIVHAMPARSKFL